MLDRRLLLKSLAGGVLAAQSQQRLVAWMYMIYPLEQWLTDYERMLEAWEAGGVRGIVIGPLRFWDGTRMVRKSDLPNLRRFFTAPLSLAIMSQRDAESSGSIPVRADRRRRLDEPTSTAGHSLPS